MSEDSGQEKQSLENWQKYGKNDKYLRSIESEEEQSYGFKECYWPCVYTLGFLRTVIFKFFVSNRDSFTFTDRA